MCDLTQFNRDLESLVENGDVVAYTDDAGEIRLKHFEHVTLKDLERRITVNEFRLIHRAEEDNDAIC
jgi:hypothetical protein